MGESREVQGQSPAKQSQEFTIVGVIDDGQKLNQAVLDVLEAGVGKEALTVVVRRQDPDEPEPLPEGVRYIVVPGDARGLEVPIGFAVAFVVIGFLFALTTPSLGIPTFLVFISLAAVLIAGVFTRVGITPILIDMEAPREESGFWNDAFELGKVLTFVHVGDRALIKPVREALQKQGADFYIIERRLEPRAVGVAVMNQARASEHKERTVGAQGV